MNNRSSNEAGSINIRALFWLTLLALCIYLAYMFGPPYTAFYMLKTEVEGEAKTAHMYTDEVLAKRIADKAAAWSVVLDEQAMQIVRDGENIRISVDYTVDLVFIGGYERQLFYSIDVQKPLKEQGRVLQ